MAAALPGRVSGPGLAGCPGGEVEGTVSSDIVRRRAEIEGVTAGRTLCDELRHVAETCGDARAYSDEAGAAAGDGWRSLTWSQVRQRVLEVAAGVAAVNERLARVQQVKRWRLLPVEWTAETEELTPTLKLKRRVVHAKYADIIDSLYAG